MVRISSGRACAAVHQEPEAVPHVVGHRAVFLDLIELRRRDQRQRILLALHDLGLQRRIDLAEIDRSGRGVERLEHRGPQRRHRHADLEALEIIRAGDRLGRRGGLAEAVVPDLVHDLEAGLLDFAAHIAAEIAVHGLPDRGIIRECEADAVDRGGRHQRRQDQAGQREELHATGAKLAQRVRIGTELAVRENLHLEPAIGLDLDRRRHLAGTGDEGMRFRQVIGEFVGELGRLRARHMRRADAGHGRCRSGTPEKRAS
jgi:hypothetical protein